MTYLRDPQQIYDASFATIRAETDFSSLPRDAEPVAVRVIHACGMTDIVRDLVISADFVAQATTAIGKGCRILVDAEMVRQGILPRFRQRNEVICTLNDPQSEARSRAQKITRSAAATSLWREHLPGAIAVIGNAPTALFTLLEMIEDGAPPPAAIIGFPVGFVGAAESKEALINNAHRLSFAALRGRKGGSAMASAAVNALMEL